MTVWVVGVSSICLPPASARPLLKIGFVPTPDHRQKRPVLSAKNIPWFATASRRKRWLVGVSGGADSVALLHLLVEAGFANLVICHLDHGLRGRASTGDARFVERLAAQLGLTCESAKADVKARMKQKGESMETAARNERHRFFAKFALKHRCPRILLAHHADDQAETVLWNLLRGSHGLKGMRARQELVTESGVTLELHRPLLGMRRMDLVTWLESSRLKWREDASNAAPVAVRNRLRNTAFPLLAEISGRDAALAFARGAADAEDTESIETWALEQAKVLDPQGRLHLPAMRTLPVALQRIALRNFLRDHGITSIDRDLIERCLTLLDTSNPAAVNLPGNARLRRREGRLSIERPI
ncbi:MAG: tRNA lysidine(34) synthetase TilS [Verrucomicrobiaceae bacterium]|nr:MAG: tRNA lysidine(34) synthetase TilS [Verrucomicrobiaceae bacterium]